MPNDYKSGSSHHRLLADLKDTETFKNKLEILQQKYGYESIKNLLEWEDDERRDSILHHAIKRNCPKIVYILLRYDLQNILGFPKKEGGNDEDEAFQILYEYYCTKNGSFDDYNARKGLQFKDALGAATATKDIIFERTKKMTKKIRS